MPELLWQFKMTHSIRKSKVRRCGSKFYATPQCHHYNTYRLSLNIVGDFLITSNTDDWSVDFFFGKYSNQKLWIVLCELTRLLICWVNDLRIENCDWLCLKRAETIIIKWIDARDGTDHKQELNAFTEFTAFSQWIRGHAMNETKRRKIIILNNNKTIKKDEREEEKLSRKPSHTTYGNRKSTIFRHKANRIYFIWANTFTHEVNYYMANL